MKKTHKDFTHKDFFDRMVDRAFKMTLHQWLMVIAFILIVCIWAVEGSVGLILSLILAVIAFFLGEKAGRDRLLKNGKRQKGY